MHEARLNLTRGRCSWHFSDLDPDRDEANSIDPFCTLSPFIYHCLRRQWSTDDTCGYLRH